MTAKDYLPELVMEVASLRSVPNCRWPNSDSYFWYFLVMPVDSMGLEETAEESEVWALASS